MRKINIVFSFDKNFWKQASVAIASLLDVSRGKCDYNIYAVVSKDITDTMRNTLKSIIKSFNTNSDITFLTANDDFASPKLNHSQAYYFRLQLPKLLKNIDKIIYADIDVVFKQDLIELDNINMGNNLLYGVKDGLNQSRPWKRYHKKTNPKYIVKQGEYINAGILLVNLKAIREEDLYKEFIALTGEKLRYRDQDMLNYICQGRIKFLPLKYNFTPRATHKYKRMQRENLITPKEITEAETSPVILHFINCNPWQEITKNSNLWWHYAKLTPFYKSFKKDFLSKANLWERFKFTVMKDTKGN